MKKENMVLKNFKLPVKMIARLERLKTFTGESISYHVRKALNIYLPKEERKHEITKDNPSNL